MSKKVINKSRERVRTVLFMVGLTFVFISVVSGAHLLTKERVERNKKLFTQKAVLVAGGVSLPATDEAIVKLYTQLALPVTNSTTGAELCYDILDERGQKVAQVWPTDGPGLWGTIKAVVGIKSISGDLISVEFIEQNETPGLGARIEEPWFREQFKGKKGNLVAVPEKTKGTGVAEFEGITGATITTTAVCDMLNRAQLAAASSASAESTTESGE